MILCGNINTSSQKPETNGEISSINNERTARGRPLSSVCMWLTADRKSAAVIGGGGYRNFQGWLYSHLLYLNIRFKEGNKPIFIKNACFSEK